MIKYWFKVIMMLVIALQSVASIVYADQIHLGAPQHLESDHSHQLTATDAQNDSQLAKETHDKADQSFYDCHNCLHGHGFVALTEAVLHLATLLSGKEQLNYQANLPPIITDLLFRPPIV